MDTFLHQFFHVDVDSSAVMQWIKALEWYCGFNVPSRSFAVSFKDQNLYSSRCGLLHSNNAH